ncbi:hypothetical protein CRG98_009541 [Punica granatum]|uniref:Uncharacterized protein n=1 Tax=Punica granatum TaxID=22663 RepID=A0A2I0KNN2_PUNGR|nr:hypothetical protein CRG98_009541 [Punica granatum]
MVVNFLCEPRPRSIGFICAQEEGRLTLEIAIETVELRGDCQATIHAPDSSCLPPRYYSEQSDDSGEDPMPYSVADKPILNTDFRIRGHEMPQRRQDPYSYPMGAGQPFMGRPRSCLQSVSSSPRCYVRITETLQFDKVGNADEPAPAQAGRLHPYPRVFRLS